MKTNISFWYKENVVFNMYSDTAINFITLAKGDTFYLDFRDVYPKASNEIVSIFGLQTGKKIIEDHEEKRKNYNCTKFRVKRVYRDFKIELRGDDTVTHSIEYNITKVIDPLYELKRRYIKAKRFSRESISFLKTLVNTVVERPAP